MINVTTNQATTNDFRFIDQIVDLETARKVSQVEEAKHYGVRTACMIDGEFKLISDYVLPADIAAKLEKA